MLDGILIELSRLLETALHRYPVATVRIMGSKKVEINKDIKEIEAVIAESRYLGLKREKLYNEILYGKWFAKIAEHYKFVVAALYDIVKEDERIRKENLKRKRRFIITIILALLGITIGIASIIFALNGR